MREKTRYIAWIALVHSTTKGKSEHVNKKLKVEARAITLSPFALERKFLTTLEELFGDYGCANVGKIKVFVHVLSENNKLVHSSASSSCPYLIIVRGQCRAEDDICETMQAVFKSHSIDDASNDSTLTFHETKQIHVAGSSRLLVSAIQKKTGENLERLFQ